MSQCPSPTPPVHYIHTILQHERRLIPEAELASWTPAGCVHPPVPDPPYEFSASFNPEAPCYTPRARGVFDRRGFDRRGSGVVLVVGDHDDTPPPDDLKYTLDPTVQPFCPDHIRRLEITPPPDGSGQVMNPAVPPFRPTLAQHIEATPPRDVDEEPGRGIPLFSPVVRFVTPLPGYGNGGHGHIPTRRDHTPSTDPESIMCEGTKLSESSKFSLTNLPDTEDCRRVRARDVRTQAAAIPTEVHTDKRYPHLFGNGEKLGLLHNKQPVIEYPLNKGSQIWREGPRKPGPGRIIVNRHDRSNPEVVYHDPTKKIVVNGRTRERFSIAEYRPAGHYSKRPRPEGEKEREAQEARKKTRREDMRTSRRSDNISTRSSHSHSAHPNHIVHYHTPRHAGPMYANPEAHLSPRANYAAPVHPEGHCGTHGVNHPSASHTLGSYHPSVGHTHPEANTSGGYYNPVTHPHAPHHQTQGIYPTTPHLQAPRVYHAAAHHISLPTHHPTPAPHHHHNPATHHLTPGARHLSPENRYLSPGLEGGCQTGEYSPSVPVNLDGYQGREYSPSAHSNPGGYHYRVASGRYNEHAGGYNEHGSRHNEHAGGYSPMEYCHGEEYSNNGVRYY